MAIRVDRVSSCFARRGASSETERRGGPCRLEWSLGSREQGQVGKFVALNMARASMARASMVMLGAYCTGVYGTGAYAHIRQRSQSRMPRHSLGSRFWAAS